MALFSDLTLAMYAPLALTAAASSCGRWQVEELVVGKNRRLYVEVRGKTIKQEDGSSGPDAEIKIYKDNYKTLLQSESFEAGELLSNEAKGASQEFKHQISDVRVGNSSGQYKQVCVEFKLDRSNNENYKQIGCVYADGYNGEENGPIFP